MDQPHDSSKEASPGDIRDDATSIVRDLSDGRPDPSESETSFGAADDAASRLSHFSELDEYSNRDVKPLTDTQEEDKPREGLARSGSRLSVVDSARSLSRIITGREDINKYSNIKEVPSLGTDRQFPFTPDESEFLVEFDGEDDPFHPYNWNIGRKICVSIIVNFYSFCNSLGSALFSESNEGLMQEFEIGNVVATIATSLYVLGFALGPMIWAPMSELFGRRAVFLPASFGFMCFSYAVATAKDLQTVMLCRFFSGFCGGSAMVLSASTIGDIFSAKHRGRAMAPFGLTVCGGPLLGPIIGGFTAKNLSLGWRWNAYWSAFLGSALFVTIFLFLKETFHPVVLSRKADIIRKKTGNWAIHSKQETLSLTLSEICVKYFARPLFMLFTEPILFLLAIYSGFTYGLIYLLLTAVPLVFSGNYKFSQGVGELPYIAIFIGVGCASIILFLFDIRYKRIISATRTQNAIPEERLPAMMIGGISFAIGLFWFCWTGDFPHKIHWMVPTVGSVFVGLGLLTIFQPAINYVVDTYAGFTASALASMTIVRSILGGVFPLFARQMFTHMHIKWAGTLLGCIALLLIPVPFIFYFYGAGIRSRSQFAAAHLKKD